MFINLILATDFPFEFHPVPFPADHPYGITFPPNLRYFPPTVVYVAVLRTPLCPTDRSPEEHIHVLAVEKEHLRPSSSSPSMIGNNNWKLGDPLFIFSILIEQLANKIVHEVQLPADPTNNVLCYLFASLLTHYLRSDTPMFDDEASDVFLVFDLYNVRQCLWHCT